MLVAQLGVFSLLGFKRYLALTEHVEVDLFEALSALDRLGEVLRGTLPLELFDLGPNGIWHVIA